MENKGLLKAGERLDDLIIGGIKIIQHQEGADPSAVLFDTVQYASSHKIDVVLADMECPTARVVPAQAWVSGCGSARVRAGFTA